MPPLLPGMLPGMGMGGPPMPPPGVMTPPGIATPPGPSMGAGTEAQVRVEINMAVKGLIRCLGLLQNVRSEEARACLQALKALEKVTPEVDEGVSQSEVRALLANAQTASPGPGAGPGGPPMRPGGGLGPMPPRPTAAAGMPFGANVGVPGLV